MPKTELPRTGTTSPGQMERQMARFKDHKPQKSYYAKDSGIPEEAYRSVAARTLYTLMASSEKAGPMSAHAAIQTGENLSVIIAECPPGDKPMLHAHFHTIEHFFCLTGRF